MDRRKRVEELFHEALALEPSARNPFLAEACSKEPGLLEEVNALISAFEQPGSFIDTPGYESIDLDEELSDSLIGTSIGRYKVIRLIKRSGMGEVYLARDTHLPRDVALKLLPLMFTGDESRLRRFTLEAEAASSLNHPNILTIHEIGHVHDVHYIATEFVDGQTLRERLSDGKLKLDEALEIAIGVTNALVASHAAGIVHRDIKPENIMIRRDGYVKVLDFGLAKLTEGPDIRVDGNSRHLSKMDTDPGTFMGTVGYLSPEQAKSLEVDTRSDVFSLGVVLYEMITGQNPFNREAFGDVVNAILRTEPQPLNTLAPNTPSSVQQIVTKALSKDKYDRYQQTEDLLADLKAGQAQLRQEATRRKLTPRERSVRWAVGVVVLIAIVLLGFAALKILNRNRQANGGGDLYTRLHFSEVQSWKNDRGESPTDARFSHDGQMIAFPMLKNEWEGIWIKQAVSGAEPRLITTDETNNNWPIWAPDDQRIAFVSMRDEKMGIWASSVNGGPAQLLGNVEGSAIRTKSWSKNGQTIYYEAGNNLFALEVATGNITQLTKLEPQASYRNFSVAPNEDRITYVGKQGGQEDIWVASLKGENPFRVTDDEEPDFAPIWHPDGRRILYLSNRGGAFQVFVAYLNRSRPTQVTVSSEDHSISDISADGSRLLDVSSRDNADIFVIDVLTGREVELTSGSSLTLWPESSPDSQLITFQATNSLDKIATKSTIFVKRATSGGTMTRIVSGGFGPMWSPDGSRIVFLRFVGGQPDVYSVNLSGEGETKLTNGGVVTNGYYLLPASKFGHSVCWANRDSLVYVSHTSGIADLWSVSADGSSRKQLAANSDSKRKIYEPVCGPDGIIAFAAESNDVPRSIWSLWVNDGVATKRIYEENLTMRPIGWLPSGNELVAAAIGPNDEWGYPTSVSLLRVPVDGPPRRIGVFESCYFWSPQLSPDGRTVAFISARGGSDNIWLTDLNGAKPKQLTSNNQPKVFFPGLNWSNDGKTIYFGKQSSVGLITTIDNF